METETVAALPEKEFVYVVALGSYYKIGRTKDLNRRLKTLCPTKFPEIPVMKLSMAVADAPFVESLLHSRYSQRRVRGEWFSISENELEQIRVFITENQSHVRSGSAIEARPRLNRLSKPSKEEKKQRTKARASQRALANRQAAEDALLRVRDFPARLRSLPFRKSLDVYGADNKPAIKSIARHFGKRLVILDFHNLNGLSVFEHSIYGDTWMVSLTNCWAEPYVHVRRKRPNGNGHK